MWRMFRGPLPSYYMAWRMIEARRREEEQIRRDIQLRILLRKTYDPAKINNREFIKRYRLTKPAFNYLCRLLREKTNLRPNKTISLELKVLCALSFYATGSYQRIVGMAKYLGQTTVSKYVKEVTDALNNLQIMNKFIKFPVTRQDRELIREKFYTKYGFPGVIGCVDGSHFHIFSPNQEEEHIFFCRKHYYSLNVQMVCDSDGRILNVNPRYGGAAHDAFIWEFSQVNEFMQELHQNNEQTWLLGDSGYPLRPWLMTPIPDAHDGSPELKYNQVHSKTRVIIENTFGMLKNRWRCLSKDRTLHYKPRKCAQIILACSVLHNLAIDFSVPEPEFDDNVDNTVGSEVPEVLRHEIVGEQHNEDWLIRGRAIRTELVSRINRLH